MKEKNDVYIVIPAYNPDEELLKLLNDLKKNEYNKIIIVDDGSREKTIFKKISKNIEIVVHEQNLGKGMALKDAMKTVLKHKNCEEIIGIITADADGQHTIDDINNVYLEMKQNLDKVILGYRNLNGKNVPFKSKIGNKIMSIMINYKTKKYIGDTQTGLRGYPLKYLDELINLDGNRYEYEMKVLLYLLHNNIPIKGVNIKCIYREKNRKSNFRPIVDSIRCIKEVYKSL